MVFRPLFAWFSRLGAYWTEKHIRKAAKKKELRDRKIREKRWNELRHPGPAYEVFSDPPQRLHTRREVSEMRSQAGPGQAEEGPSVLPTSERQKTLNVQSSTFTLDLGRIQAGELFYRRPEWIGVKC